MHKAFLHCEKAAVSATNFLGMLRRTFSVISKELFTFTYKTYGIVEFC